MRIRKNVHGNWDFQKEFDRFVTGVKLLKKETGHYYSFDGSPINTYDMFVDRHINTVKGSRYNHLGRESAHEGPAFLPWHRSFLLKFENEMQRVLEDEEYSIPYWDWQEFPYNSIALGMYFNIWDHRLMGGDGDPINDDAPFSKQNWPLYKDHNNKKWLYRHFKADSLAQKLPSTEEVLELVHHSSTRRIYDSAPWDKTSQDGFRNRIEGWVKAGSDQEVIDGPAFHNLVHRYIGGAMYDMGSPNDPIFWMHHANIDRIWAWWQSLYNTPYLPDQVDSYNTKGQKKHDTMFPAWWAADGTEDTDFNKPNDFLNTIDPPPGIFSLMFNVSPYTYDKWPDGSTPQI